MNPRRVKTLIIAFAVVLGVTGANCDTGQDTHPNAPQQPGPERGGPDVPKQPKEPKPVEGDPQPHLRDHLEDLKTRTKNDPSQLALVVVWLDERKFYIEYTLNAGAKAQRIEQRAQNMTGGWWTKMISVRPGQVVGLTAGPTNMEHQAKGTAQCWIYHAKGAGGLIGDWQTVPRGPCAVSYTVPA